MVELKGRRVLVVGLGLSGLAAARFLVGRGAVVSATDLRPADQLGPAVDDLAGLGVSLHLGGHPDRLFQEADLIVVSPGIALDRGPLKEAVRAGQEIIGEMGLAAAFLKATLVAVTGTNGKSTTTALIAHLLAEAGQDVFLGGNIGRPLIEALDLERAPDVAVVEVSSFQLETMPTFRPKVALLLNLTVDHLDRHRTFDAYARLKARIWADMEPEDRVIINAAQPLLLDLTESSRAQVLLFGLGQPTGPGAFMANGRVTIVDPDRPETIINTSAWPLPGRHNQENLTAALLAARLLGLDRGQLELGLASFKGLPHRLQLSGVIGGVEYYNDSKATNPDAAAKSVAAFDRPVVLIAGGRNKGAEFEPLIEAVQGRVRLALLIGEAAEELAEVLGRVVPVRRVDTLAEAVAEAHRQAEPGDVVLLAPACASFDQFANYGARGEAFNRAVERLAA